MRAEVIAIGDELTTGQRLDTNSQWLSTELGILGIPVGFHTTVCDTLEDGIAAFRIAADRSDIVVATGGLGPTADDLTRDVLAALAGEPLELSTAALATVESRFARRGVPMPESNRRQALFPRGSRIIPNPDGTAPGIDIDVRRADGGSVRIIALPGVPAEMRRMWVDSVASNLLVMLPNAGTIRHRRIKCFGAGESAIEAMLPDLIRRGRDPLVGITAHEATITLRIVARGHDAAECLRMIRPTEEMIRQSLGSLVYGTEDDELEDAVVREAGARGWTLATIEVGTAGRVASMLAQAQARADGSGVAAYRGGVVATLPLAEGVDAAAARVRADYGTSIGLAVGPIRPGNEGRDVIEFAVADSRGVERRQHVLGGGPALAASRAAKSAIDMVRSRLADGHEVRP